MKKNPLKIKNQGFTLIESLVGIAVFAVIAIGVYEVSLMSSRLTEASRLMVTSAALATEQFEIIHNLPYDDVGVIAGLPLGKIPHQQTIRRDNSNFLVETFVQNIDDPFDGTADGTPKDTSPADYKLVEFKISIPDNPRFPVQNYTEYIAPKSLEGASTNGSLFIHVFDANGQPVPGAHVHIENHQTVPDTLIEDTTNNDGDLNIVDVPPGIEAYEISVSKTGYSQEQTYPTGGPGNPNPLKPHATVVIQEVTQTSFSIDKTGSLNMESVTNTCTPVGNISFSLAGAKLLGTPPDVLKYDSIFFTDGSGLKNITGLEQDTYNLNITDSVYDLSGTISPISFSLAADGTQDVKVVVAPKDPRSLLISVKQAGTNLPASDATVTLVKDSTTKVLITGRGFLRQSDWSGGFGQFNLIDQTRYYDSDGNIETNDPTGEIKLKKNSEFYAESGELTSSSFDTGSVSNFYQLLFTPTDQPAPSGTSSVRLQIATNNDNNTWNFIGPDGTASTSYSATDGNISALHNGDRYFRYKIYLSTASTTFTPNVGEISFTFTSLCVPPGQVMFSGLEGGDYAMNITKAGFLTLDETINISDPWQQKEETLMPE